MTRLVINAFSHSIEAHLSVANTGSLDKVHWHHIKLAILQLINRFENCKIVSLNAGRDSAPCPRHEGRLHILTHLNKTWLFQLDLELILVEEIDDNDVDYSMIVK